MRSILHLYANQRLFHHIGSILYNHYRYKNYIPLLHYQNKICTHFFHVHYRMNIFHLLNRRNLHNLLHHNLYSQGT